MRVLSLVVGAAWLSCVMCSIAGTGICSRGTNLALRGGYDDGDGGGGGGGGGGYRSRGGGGYGGRGGGFRGRGGGFRGRGRGGRRPPPPDGPIDELKLYVGGLNWEIDNAGLQDVFGKYGQCEAEVMIDKYSQRSRGFGFVTFQDANAASSAKEAMDGKEIMGRTIAVNHARQRVDDNGNGHDEGAME